MKNNLKEIVVDTETIAREFKDQFLAAAKRTPLSEIQALYDLIDIEEIEDPADCDDSCYVISFTNRQYSVDDRFSVSWDDIGIDDEFHYFRINFNTSKGTGSITFKLVEEWILWITTCGGEWEE